MPVILQLPPDLSFDMFVQGELMREQALNLPVVEATGLTEDDEFMLPSSPSYPIVSGMQSYAPMMSDNKAGLDGKFTSSVAANNASIATSCGTLVPFDIGRKCMISDFIQNTSRWVLNVVTEDTLHSPLADVRVMAMETGQLAVGQTPIQAEGISDGSGILALEVPTNTAYLLVGYKPDVGGVSVQTLTPTQM